MISFNQFIFENSRKQSFDKQQDFEVLLNNGKKKIVRGKTRRAAKQSLGTDNLIIGIKRFKHLGPSTLKKHR